VNFLGIYWLFSAVLTLAWAFGPGGSLAPGWAFWPG